MILWPLIISAVALTLDYLFDGYFVDHANTLVRRAFLLVITPATLAIWTIIVVHVWLSSEDDYPDPYHEVWLEVWRGGN